MREIEKSVSASSSGNGSTVGAPLLKARFSSQTIAFLTGHSVARYVRSLAPLTPLTHSAALRFSTLAALTHSIHGLDHSLRSLPRGTVEIPRYMFTL